MKALAALILLNTATAQVAPPEIEPAKMSPAQISAHNAALQKTDANYIRCIRYAAPGSLIENKRTCRTNAQWIVSNRIGEQNARDTTEAMRSRLETPKEDVCKDPDTC